MFKQTQVFEETDLVQQEDYEFIQQISKNKINSIELIYKATRDGFLKEKFHELCDNKGKTLIVIKSHLEYIFGAYADQNINCQQTWCSGKGDSFIFQLNKRTKHQCIDKKKEMFGSENYFIKFGNGADLLIQNEPNFNQLSYSRLGHSYELQQDIQVDSKEALNYLAGSQNFKIIEIEVFLVH